MEQGRSCSLALIVCVFYWMHGERSGPAGMVAVPGPVLRWASVGARQGDRVVAALHLPGGAGCAG